MKTKYYPLRRGFNDCLGYYQKRDDVSTTQSKGKYKEDVNSQPEANKARVESNIPTIEQFSLNFDLY